MTPLDPVQEEGVEFAGFATPDSTLRLVAYGGVSCDGGVQCDVETGQQSTSDQDVNKQSESSAL